MHRVSDTVDRLTTDLFKIIDIVTIVKHMPIISSQLGLGVVEYGWCAERTVDGKYACGHLLFKS
jgi:hypothetical protein